MTKIYLISFSEIISPVIAFVRFFHNNKFEIFIWTFCVCVIFLITKKGFFVYKKRCSLFFNNEESKARLTPFLQFAHFHSIISLNDIEEYNKTLRESDFNDMIVTAKDLNKLIFFNIFEPKFSEKESGLESHKYVVNSKILQKHVKLF